MSPGILLADKFEFEWNQFRIRGRFGSFHLPKRLEVFFGIFEFAEPAQHFALEEASDLALFGRRGLVRDHFAVGVQASLQICTRAVLLGFVLYLPGRLKVRVSDLRLGFLKAFIPETRTGLRVSNPRRHALKAQEPPQQREQD